MERTVSGLLRCSAVHDSSYDTQDAININYVGGLGTHCHL